MAVSGSVRWQCGAAQKEEQHSTSAAAAAAAAAVVVAAVSGASLRYPAEVANFEKKLSSFIPMEDAPCITDVWYYGYYYFY